MVNYNFLRPKSALGLPTSNNDSIITCSSTSSSHHLPPQISPQNLPIARPRLCLSTVEPALSNATPPLEPLRTKERGERDNERGENRVRLRKGVVEVKSAAAAMVRKALQGSRDMRPIAKLTPMTPIDLDLFDSGSSSPANITSRDRVRDRWRESTMSRPVSDQHFAGFRASFRHRRNAISGRPKNSSAGSSEDYQSTRCESTLPEPIITSFYSPVILPSSLPPPGSAARASAAEHNKIQQERLCRTDTFMTKDDRHLYDEVMEDEITFRNTSPCSSMEIKKSIDPIKFLPVELSSLILTFLDDKSLLVAGAICRAWREVANSGAVWRSHFYQKYSRRASNSLPYIAMGGQGLGGDSRTKQGWKQMSRARKQIEDNWQNKNPKAIYFSGHTDSVYCCQFDETKIITGSRDRTVRVWELQPPYRCLKVIGGPSVKPLLPTSDTTLDVHPTATVHNQPTVNGTLEGDRIFHVPRDYHSASILCLQFDHEIAVTGSSDNTCIVWDIITWQPIKRLSRHTAGVLDVCFDDEYIVSCSKDTTICVWSRKTNELVNQLCGHRGPVNAVQLRSIGGRKLLVSASGDGYSKLWSLDDQKEVKRFESQDRGLAAVEYSDDGHYVLAGGNDQVIYKYDVRTAECIMLYKGHTNLVRSLFLDSANGRVLSGSYDQGIRVYNFEDGAEMGIYDNWTTSWILAAKSDYRRIVATSQDGRALMMDFGFDVKDAYLLEGNLSDKLRMPLPSGCLVDMVVNKEKFTWAEVVRGLPAIR